MEKEKNNILEKFYKGELQDGKIIQNLLCNDFSFSSELLIRFIKENKYKNLEYIQKYYIYDNSFILKLLLIYQRKISLSQKELTKFIFDEENKINVNIKDEQGETPLTLACNKKNNRIINILLKLKANVNKTNDKGYYPLAFVKDKKRIVKKLVEHGADINIYDVNGDTPLIYACKTKNIDMLKFFLEHSNVNVNKLNKKGEISMNVACRYGYLEFIIPLLKFGGIINFEDNQGGTPLILACQNGSYSVVKYLINNGANINQENKDHDTPLTIACRYWKEKIIDLLIDEGANVNQENKDHDTPLMIICKNCNNTYESFYSQTYIDVVKRLVEKGADINKINSNGENAFDIAYRKRHKYKATVVKYLIDHETIIHDKIYKKVIIDICAQSNLDILKSLIKRDININIEDDNNNTPLLVSCRQENHENLSIVKYLIENGANINQVNKCGDNALIIACQNENEEIVNYLIEQGININHENFEGDTALIKACENRNKNIIYNLIEKGANILHENKDGNTALLIACKNCYSYHSNVYFEIIKYLIEKGKEIRKIINKPNKNGETIFLAACKKQYRNNQIKILNNNNNNNNNNNCNTIKNGNKNQNDIDTFRQIHLNILKFLIEQGAKVDIEDNFGNTSLIASCRQSNYHPNIVKFLIQHDANIHYENKYGQTPLIISCMDKLESNVQYLIDHDVNINYVNKDGDNALIFACHSQNQNIIQNLVEHGANMNQENKKGETPLIILCKNCTISSENTLLNIIKYLIEKGIDINKANINGDTPLIVACENENNNTDDDHDMNNFITFNFDKISNDFTKRSSKLVNLLLDCGANPRIINKDNETALSIAVKSEDQDIIGCFNDFRDI